MNGDSGGPIGGEREERAAAFAADFATTLESLLGPYVGNGDTIDVEVTYLSAVRYVVPE